MSADPTSRTFRRRVARHMARHPVKAGRAVIAGLKYRMHQRRQLLQCSECGAVGKRRPLERHECTGTQAGIRARCSSCGARRRVRGFSDPPRLLCKGCR